MINTSTSLISLHSDGGLRGVCARRRAGVGRGRLGERLRLLAGALSGGLLLLLHLLVMLRDLCIAHARRIAAVLSRNVFIMRARERRKQASAYRRRWRGRLLKDVGPRVLLVQRRRHVRGAACADGGGGSGDNRVGDGARRRLRRRHHRRHGGSVRRRRAVQFAIQQDVVRLCRLVGHGAFCGRRN